MYKNVISRNNINRFGNGSQTIMFSHGFGCDQNMWRFITPAFEKEYDIILFDHVGSGKSDEKQYDFEKYSFLGGYANDIVEICRVLKLDQVIFVGHSVSSIIGLLAVGKKPDFFKTLVLVGPSPRYINDADYEGGFSKEDIDDLIETLESNYLGWTEIITPVILGNSAKPEISKELQNSFCRMNPKIAKHFAKVTFLSDNRDDLQKVAIPTLILQCHPDVIAPLAVGKFVHENMQNSHFIQLNASGHCPHMTAPEETTTAIKSYLESQW